MGKSSCPSIPAPDAVLLEIPVSFLLKSLKAQTRILSVLLESREQRRTLVRLQLSNLPIDF